MKNLFISGLSGIMLFALVSSVQAQIIPPLNEHLPEKPLLFASLPEKFECNTLELTRIFNAQISEKIALKINPSFQVEGLIAEKIQKSDYLLSMNIRLSNNAQFNISRIAEKGQMRYVGRIMSISNGDILILTKENDKYFLIKQQQKYSMVE